MMAAMLGLCACSPETGSVTGITRTPAGGLEAVVLTCEGTADMVGIETDGDPDARTDFVWTTQRTRKTLRMTLTSETLERGEFTSEEELLGVGSFTSEVVGYDTSHRWNSLPVHLTSGVLAELEHGQVTYGSVVSAQRTVSEEEFARTGCDLLDSLYSESP